MDRLLRAWRTAAWLSIVCAAAPAGCSREPPRLNVLIISIDTLRADHLGCYGYAPYAQPVSPRIDELAKRGLVFKQCWSPRGQTAPSLGSLMTGLYPSHHGVLDNGFPFAAGVRSLAQELAHAGYDAHAFLGFLPGGRDGKATLGIPPENVFEARKVARRIADSACDELAERRFEEFVGKRGQAPAPFFAWVHLFDVHQPYTPPPPYDTLFAGDYSGPFKLPAAAATQELREQWFSANVQSAIDARVLARAPLERDDAKYVTALYDGGVREADERVGRMVDALAKAGLAENTLVIVTADHGEELGQHNHFWNHGNSVHEPVLHVPLIFAGPGVRGGGCDALVQNVDVLPTVLQWIGAPAPAESDGLSFAALLRPGGESAAAPRTVAWSEWQDLILGARTRDLHLIFNPRGASPKKPPYFGVAGDGGYFVGCAELYDLDHDPHELRDVWEERKADVAELRERVTEEYGRRGFGGDRPLAPRSSDPLQAQRAPNDGYEVGVSAAREDVVVEPERCREH